MEEVKQIDAHVDLAAALLQPAPSNQHAQQNNNSKNGSTEQPVKVRKKPGRKPNPASPALRKAQNRAAQRAFRERKERHLRELEAAVKQMREQRDKLQAENDQLKSDADILRSENWYLKGIVLTLQLVCFRHNLVIPQHSPYMNEEALSLMAQSIPEPISAYISANANNKLPIPSSLQMEPAIRKPRDRYLSSGSIVITRDGIRSADSSTCYPTSIQSPPGFVGVDGGGGNGNRLCHSPMDTTAHPLDLPNLSPVMESKQQQPEPCTLSPPRPLAIEPLTSNLAAVQTLRLRLRLQSACAQMDAASFAIQPTILQLTIPHDPRIDLIPTPHMRDRMILFRDLFDLDDCFRCLIGNSIFHGGDPAIAANWELPPEFFDKFWFLTIDFSLQRLTNKWRRMQGLNELKAGREEQQCDTAKEEQQQQQDKPRPAGFTAEQLDEIAAMLRSEEFTGHKSRTTNYASSLVSDTSSSGSSCEDQAFFGPVHLTDGYNLSFNDPPYPHAPWDTATTPASLKDDDYEMMLDSLINTEEV